MQASFEGCVALILRTEGGYTNNPNDRGGPTNLGITLATARACISPSFTAQQLRELTKPEAEIVYKRDYWDKVAGDKVPAGVDYTLADYAVNSGPGKAIKTIQALCDVPQTGVMSDALVAAIAQYDESDIVTSVNAERLAYMKTLGASWTHFGAGWTNRVNGVRTHSLAMVRANAAVPVSAYTDQYMAMAVQLPTGKAMPADATNAQAGAAGAGSLAAISAFSAAHHVGGYVAMALAFAAVGGTAAAIVALQSRLNAAENPVNVTPLTKKAA